MSLDKWLVLAAGVGAIAWLNWHFFRAVRRSGTASAAVSGMQEVLITVRGGYDPAEIHVRAGAPVRLVFDRQETSSCSEEVVLGDFGIRKFLPAHERTAVELTVPAKGRYAITCGMSMLHGTLVAE
ncbi:MAG TPA: cupredoxin domain-containing protein [Gemmatimonadaceae bacterium]|nr:cupredoxin domain-containing protein [Gemmatimonadaceae bacterium]